MERRNTSERWIAFGEALAIALAASRRTQSAVAKEIGVSTSTISDWKLGKSEPERPEVTFALERALGCPAGELSVHLGYLPPEAALGSWEETLGLDPEVDDVVRRMILAMLDTWKKGRGRFE